QKSVVFALEGHAGLGKSRIVREIKKVLRDDNFKVLQGNCLSYGSPLSYHPWIEIISSLFGFESHDSTEAKMKKVLRLLDSTGKSMSEWLPLIGEVLSLDFGMNDLVKNLDKSVKKEKFYDIVTGMLCFLSEKNPLALVIEDYHWADNSSSELLSHLSRNCKDKRILFVIPFRPSEGKTSTEVLNEDVRFVLRELSPAETGELIDNLLNVKNLDNSIKKLVAEKSQGNPFYVEELVKSMIEQKYITKTNECWSFDMKGREVALPDSVEGVILSRIDRLDIAERNVLQTASVLGREFRYEILNSLCKEEKSLKRILSRLNGLDLIKTDEGESEEFFFKHILTCETAYNTLSFAKRREIHFQAGSVLEKDNLNIASNTGMLSYHFHKANAFTKSMDYSIKAGERAKVVYANDEAIEYFSRALEDYSADKEKEKKLAALAYEGRASVFSFVGRGDEGIKDAETSIKIAQEIQDEELTALCLSESCIIYELTSNFDRMKDSAEKALSIYKNKSDVIGMARSYNYIGMYYGITGEPIKELEMLKEAVELLSDRTKLDDGKIPDNASAEAYQLLRVVLNNIGYVQRMLGETNAALENYEKSLELRKLIKDTTGVAQVLNNIGMIYGRGGDIPKALPYFEESIKTYEEIGNKKGLGSSLVNYGYLSGRAGDSKKELECYEKGLAIQRQINDRYVMSFTLGNIGNYYLRMNNPYKALEYQMESLSIKKEINDRTGMAAAYSNIARCYEVLGDAEKRFENMREELKIYEEAGDEKKAAELREKMKE
ncbi:MAG: tetratricopeptide repeat protein, partial [bacterium]|nr:tetratricopeptide repeat protein [bacterium]